MRAEKQKSPAPRDQRGRPGGILDHQNCTAPVEQLQATSLAYSVQLRNIEERCLAALWCNPRMGYPRCIHAGLCDAEQFAYTEHRQLFRVLMSFGSLYAGEPVIPVIGEILQRYFDRSFIGLDDRDDLPRLRWMESTSAGLEVYARAVVRANRKRMQLARLIRRGIAIAADPLGDGKVDPPDEWESLFRKPPTPAPRPTISRRALARLGRGAA